MKQQALLYGFPDIVHGVILGLTDEWIN